MTVYEVMFNTSPGVPSIDPIAMTLVSWRPSLIRIVMTSTSPVTSAGTLGRSEEEGKDRVGRVACGTVVKMNLQLAGWGRAP